MKKKVILECMGCGKRFVEKIYTSLTTGPDTDTNYKFMHNEINHLVCEHCGNEGFVLYPLRVTDKYSQQCLCVIPSENAAFRIVEIKGKKPLRVFYDYADLQYQTVRLQGGYVIPLPHPPAEHDLCEGLEKKIITGKEAELLKEADWRAIHKKAEASEDIAPLSQKEETLCGIYCRLLEELDYVRKVVRLRP